MDTEASEGLRRLRAELKSSDPSVRAATANEVVALGLDDHKAFAVALLGDEDTLVVEAAIRALLACGEPWAADTIFDTLGRDDDDDRVDHMLYFLAPRGEGSEDWDRLVRQAEIRSSETGTSVGEGAKVFREYFYLR